MASLLSLPNEILINILIAAPTTRTLLRFSSVNRRMRAIWLEHSRHIIFSAYKRRIPHVEEAIILTLTEIDCAEVSPSRTRGSYLAAHDLTRQPSPLAFCLLRVLRNAGLASSVCDAADNNRTLYKISWPTEGKWTELLRAYHLIRHTILAYDSPLLRPSVFSALSACTEQMHEANYWLVNFLIMAAPMQLIRSHGLLEINPKFHEFHGPIEDTLEEPLRMADSWFVAEKVITAAKAHYEDKEMDPPSFDKSKWEIDDPSWT